MMTMDIESPMESEFRVVQATPDDATEVHALLVACGHHMSEAYGFRNWVPPAPLARVEADAVKGSLYVVYAGVALVATFTLAEQPSVPYGAIKWNAPGARTLYLNRLAVLPELQGKGLGGWCMNYIEESACQRGCLAVRFDVLKQNASLRRFYERLGYVPRGERAHSGWEFVCYEKGM
jgi:GNAT superfamily N-acetyltransferase